jgi:hypothetical protein
MTQIFSSIVLPDTFHSTSKKDLARYEADLQGGSKVLSLLSKLSSE